METLVMIRFRKRTGSLSTLALISGALSASACADTPPALDVTLTSEPSSLVIFPAVATFDEIGETMPFTARVQDQYGHAVAGLTIRWESSADSIVTVTSDGMVTSVGSGQATVTVSVTDGTLKAHSAVTVR